MIYLITSFLPMPLFSKKMIYLTLGIFGAILIIALVGWFLLRRAETPVMQPAQTTTQNPTTGTGGGFTGSVGATFTPTSTTSTSFSPAQVGLQQTAFLFTERYGSYSTESNFENFSDVRTIITDRLANQLRAVEGRGVASDVFSGVVTKALQFTLEDESAVKTSARVRTQRQETLGISSAPRIFYQDITLSLVKINDMWLVDQAEWQPL